MLQLILALSFIGMIVTPAVVAAFSGKKETEVEQDEMETAEVAAPARMARRKRTVESTKLAFEAPTLPMHGTLGMAGR